MADDFGLKIGLEGEKEFKKALSEINQSFKVLGSEMKLVSSQFDKNDQSVEALTARNTVLNKEIEAQKQKIETLKKALENAATSFGENDRRTQAWQIQLNNAEAALNDMERELQQNNDALDRAAGEFDDAEKQADDFGDEVEDAGKQSDDAGGKFEKLGAVCKAAGVAIAAAFAAVSAAAVAAGKALVDKGMPEVASHWQNRFVSMVRRYNETHQEQMPKITPHVCRHTYCSNMARAGMNPKTLQYLMGHSDIGVTMNTYTHLGLDDAKDEMIRLEELNRAKEEVAKVAGEKKPLTQRSFRAV